MMLLGDFGPVVTLMKGYEDKLLKNKLKDMQFKNVYILLLQK